jgi:N-acetylneuraminic acid mutarotase
LTHAIPITGGNVLVVGDDWTGCNAEGPAVQDAAADAEVYLAETGTWKPVASLNALRSGLAAVPLADGRSLVVGGMTDEGDPFSSVKLFDPAAGTWSQPGLMGYARIEPSATLLKNGRVLATGGWFASSTAWRMVPTTEIFDPATGNWTNTGALHTPRSAASAVTLADGRVLVVGGWRDSSRNLTPTAEVWDPATGAWSNAGSLPAVRSGFSLIALADGSALLVGGAGTAGVIPAAASALRFNPATKTWSSAGTMITAATDRTVVALADGLVLVAGGFKGAAYTAAAELYDPATGTWTATVPLPQARRAAAGALLADGSVLLAGGYSGTIVPGPGGTGGGSGCPVIVAEAYRYVPAVP